ncbi:MAG: hypothetical protein E6L09_01270 [Verrucomicrobia bacterium]|nr:MAG: hypothetical protein E6L09_01270 [Verrucomicrobiota bacterium]
MNRAVVGQASRLPPGRLAPGFFAGETPAKTAGTAAPLLTVSGSWYHEPETVSSGAAVPAVFAGVSPAKNPGARRPGGRRDACPTTARFMESAAVSGKGTWTLNIGLGFK